jgi:hypothetical protein
MNAYRMFAFATAILLTSFLFRVIADRYLYEQPHRLAMATDGRHGRAQ